MLSKSTWAVLGLTLDIELFTQLHYRSSIDPDPNLSELWKDVFLFHWREESQHAILDELEWLREDAKLSDAQRDAAVDDLIALVGAVDGILQAQSAADADYFFKISGHGLSDARETAGARRRAQGLPLAVHRLRRAGAALRGNAAKPRQRRADAAYRARRSRRSCSERSEPGLKSP